MLHRNLFAVCILATIAGCTATPNAGPKATTDGVLEIAPSDHFLAVGDSPVGWVYASNRPDGKPDLCLYVWPNATWTLASETVPGYYGERIVSGSIVNGVAQEFPTETLAGAGILYSAGNLTASLNGTRLETRGDGDG